MRLGRGLHSPQCYYCLSTHPSFTESGVEDLRVERGTAPKQSNQSFDLSDLWRSSLINEANKKGS